MRGAPRSGKVRTATAADVDTLFDIRTSVRENYMSRAELAAIGVTPASVSAILQGSGRAWIAWLERQAVAFSMADAARATVFAMFVRPDFEGRGLGRRLLTEAERWLFAQGCREIWLTTGTDAIRAQGFYRHLGWTETGLAENGEIRFVKRHG